MLDDRSTPSSPPPESGMGGAGDSGAHGRHPASSPGGVPRAEPAVGDAAIERRRGGNENYTGPERRQGRGRSAS